MLVISIILMIIIASTVIISVGDIISEATKATFYQDMKQMGVQKEISKIQSFLDNGNNNDVQTESAFLSRNLTPEELNDLKDTLKAEIIYVRNSFGEKEVFTTKQVWKNNMFECQEMYEVEEYLKGLSTDIYYISKEITSAKDYEFIYDRVSDTCFKIKQTRIGKYIVHSLEYAKFAIDGENAKGIGTVDFDSGVIKASDGTLAYEPDLKNFSYATQVVYYSPDFSTEYTMSIKEFIDEGHPSTKTVNGQKYTFANYVTASSSGTSVWANIKTTANGLDSYWVWIPRYAYALDGEAYTSDIIFVDINDKPLDTETHGETLPEGYVVHEAFKQKAGLKGIWFSKYDPSPAQTIPVDKINPESPNLANFNTDSLTIVYYNSSGTTHEEAYNNEEFQAKFENGVPPRTLDVGGVTYYWYDYPTKKWANIKTTANELNSYWVWIPRFAYKLETGTTQVILIDENDKPIDTETYGEELPASFTVHEAFKQKAGLMGLWFGKYDPTKVTIETETGGTTEEETGEGETT